MKTLEEKNNKNSTKFTIAYLVNHVSLLPILCMLATESFEEVGIVENTAYELFPVTSST